MAEPLHVALWEPEIPPNTGNIARSCAATGTVLHLIGKLGFHLDDKHLKRAGIDYWPAVTWFHHRTWEEFEAAVGRERIVCIETGEAPSYTRMLYSPGDCLLFGNESAGLPAFILERYSNRRCQIPMPGSAVRSLNLATSAGIVLYEALRQLHGW